MHPILAFCPYLSLNKPIEFADWRLGPLSAFEDLWADAKFKLHAQAFLAKFVNHSGEPIERPSIICRRNGQVDGKPPTGLTWPTRSERTVTASIGPWANGVRTIPLGPHTIAALTAHRQRVSRQAPEDLVFGNRKGDPLRESKLLTKVLQPAAETAGLGRVTWHQFRHIHSSLLNDLKVPVKIAQEQLGHVSISTTLNIYTHVVDASHRSAVELVEERLFTELDPNGPKLAIVPATGASVSARSA